jgi:VanZ family protein
MWDNSTTDGPRRRRAWRWAAAWACVIFVLSSIPGNAFPDVPGRFTDKLVHIALYGVLGLLVGRALASSARLGGARLVVLTGLLATAYGITDELHQLLTPRRSCDWHDVVADAIGGLLGGLLAATVLARRKPRSESTSESKSSKESINQP